MTLQSITIREALVIIRNNSSKTLYGKSIIPDLHNGVTQDNYKRVNPSTN